MVIQITISNRAIYTFLLIIGLILLGTGVYAVSNPGHSGDEIEVTETLCQAVTGHGCGVDNSATDTNAGTICPNTQFLRGNGKCYADANTQLTELQVDTYVANNGYIKIDKFNSDNKPKSNTRGEPTVNEIKAWAKTQDTDTSCTISFAYDTNFCTTCGKISCPDGKSISGLGCKYACSMY